ncbi:hypothetical protein F5148DRAFT_1318877 [Russula earlei]|uniref:Uncharacterized protein n=1 Tax=Russula earlei TaxID=71964 RepID=A0ACC0UR83_9AGAM|nr:hypothetical protein F5148DRAFT_1318877 [Russula earlei]
MGFTSSLAFHRRVPTSITAGLRKLKSPRGVAWEGGVMGLLKRKRRQRVEIKSCADSELPTATLLVLRSYYIANGRQEDFLNGNTRSYLETGKYFMKDASDPVYSFTYQSTQYITSVGLTDLSEEGSVTFKNYAGFEITLTFPSSQGNIPNGSTKTYSEKGTYVVNRNDETLFSLNYHKGTVTILLGGLAR